MAAEKREGDSQGLDGGWRGHNLSQLRLFRSLALREKMEAVEGMANVVRRLRRVRGEGVPFLNDAGVGGPSGAHTGVVRETDKPYGATAKGRGGRRKR